jgi:hypothetical protein
VHGRGVRVHHLAFIPVSPDAASIFRVKHLATQRNRGLSAGTWYTVHAWYMVHGKWYMVHGTRYTVHGTWYTVHGTRYTVHGTRYMVHGTWYMVLGTLSGQDRLFFCFGKWILDMLVVRYANSVTLKMEAVRSSETSLEV